MSLGRMLARIHEVQSLALHELGVVVNAYNPSVQEVKTGIRNSTLSLAT